ncbi:MAG: hypothetical protein MUO26_13375 [Methanotrichaceae archaeon]|nr:hypothetical protein [Methanotrichaceae archaeon]
MDTLSDEELELLQEYTSLIESGFVKDEIAEILGDDKTVLVHAILSKLED